MVSALLLVFCLFAAGVVARRLGRFPDNGADVLNRFIIDICLPATILRVVPSLQVRADLLVLVVTPWVVGGLSYLASLVAARWLGLDAKVRTVLFVMTALGNTSFLGFPLCSALLGDAALPMAAVYDQIGSFLLLSIVVPIAVGRATDGERPNARRIAGKVLTFPPFIALLVALLPITWPSVLEPMLTAAAAPLVPLAMFSVGLKLPLTRPNNARVLVLGLTLKLVLLPLCALGFLKLLSIPPLVLQVAVLETAMPSMITAGAVLMAAGLAVELVAALVGWGLILSLVTVPLWAFTLGGL